MLYLHGMKGLSSSGEINQVLQKRNPIEEAIEDASLRQE
jgi:hypothetical protein